jgi:PAS domain S-box-containing protein
MATDSSPVQVRDQLSAVEAQLKHVLEASPAVTYTLRVDPDGVSSLWASANVYRILGYTSEAVLADGWWVRNVHADDRGYAQAAFDRLYERGEISHQYRFRHEDGTYRWIRDDLRLVRDDSGRPAEIVGSWMDITDRMEADIALRESVDRFRQLAENIEDVFWLYDCDEARPIYVNPRFETIWGRAVEEIYANPRIWAESLHPEDRERVLAYVDAMRKQEYGIEYRIIRPDGEVRWIRERASPVRDADGRTRRTAGVAEDITSDKWKTEALRESEEKLRQVTENIREIFWMFDTEFSEMVYVSRAYEEICGHSVESLYRDARSFLVSVHPDDVERLLSAMGGAREGTPFSIEIRLLHPDESVRWLRCRGFPVLDERGAVYRVVGTTEDITTRKRAEADLAAAEEHYHRLVETSPYAIYALDEEGRFTEVNQAATEILARSAEDLIGRHMAEVLAPMDLPRAVSARNEKFSRATVHTDQEVRVIRPSGERRLVHVRSSLIERGGVPVGTHGIVRDITEERAREGEMRLLAAALESLNEGVSVMRFDGQLIYANSTHARLLGYDVDGGELPNDGIFLPDEGEAGRAADIFRTVARHGTWSGHVRRRRSSDGQILPLDMVLGRVDREGEESVVFNILHDVTEEIQKEQQLRRVERLASVGTMVGGIAHELNNPLHAVRNFAELMLMEPRDERDREALELIRSEADRAAKVVADLRLFARQAQEEGREREALDLNDVVRHVLQIRRYALETSSIEIVEDLAVDLPSVWANRGETEQVVVNLIANAEEAMIPVAGEKRLVLRTRRGAVGATLQVGDTGTGIPAEHLERIFDPFFTTKPPRGGTGLGLSLVHAIVHEHGGDLLVESELGKGTTFRIDLPSIPTSGGGSVPDDVHAQLHDRPLRILLVDDEEALRRSGVLYFTNIGHHIDVAADGAEALSLLEGETYDAIISDLRMPGMGGETLLQRLRERGGGLEKRVIFVTGDAVSTRATRALSITGVPVLVKPVDLETIARTVEEVARMAHVGGEA